MQLIVYDLDIVDGAHCTLFWKPVSSSHSEFPGGLKHVRSNAYPALEILASDFVHWVNMSACTILLFKK